MDDPFIEQIHDKFMKCPECGYYSVSQSRPSFLQKVSRPLRRITAYSCSNCGLTFTLDRHSNLRVALTFGSLGLLTALFLWIALARPAGQQIPETQAATHPPIESEIRDKQWPTPIPEERTTPSLYQDPAPTPEPGETLETTAPTAEDMQQETEPTPEEPSVQDPSASPTTLPVNTPEEANIPQDNPEEPFGYIAFGSQHRFGVNWSVTADGLVITRISQGPMRDGGIRVGDVLLRVNDQPVGNGDDLTHLRNEVVDGKRSSVSLLVRQKGEERLFMIVKEKPRPSSP